MDAVKKDQGNKAAAKKMMSGAAGKKKKKPSHHSWMAMGLYYPASSSSSGKSRGQPQPATMAAEGKNADKENNSSIDSKKKRSMSIGRSMASICSTKESSVMSRGGGAAASSSRSLKAPDAAAAISATSSFNSETTAATTVLTTSSSSPPSSELSSPLSSFGGSFRNVQIRKLSGCTECQFVFDPSTRSLGFPCADCDEVFVKAESLELHRATHHAVSELGPEDTSRNIVEIIFQSSWLRKKEAPVCRIERVLKVQSSDRTVKRFEQYKESIKEKASNVQGKKNARCVADGNELLRFYSTTFTCALGAAGGTALCRALSTQCKLCGIVRDGFRVDGEGKIATMATSGRAHDTAELLSDGEKKAMLVCRVVAGRVKRDADTRSSQGSDCDSVSPCSSEGLYSDLDELFVFNPRAILPCFVVIYSGY
ncbi:hypothetical protein PR202_gb16690 [Eleusine coracana subsp. coracana]|uniref:C2H2-type domain-containing protein n=1 Tax=Eleusine coracana subsp. coracana TaxID=191504 RepID=A0AAV5F0W1_ELECO|nr:hypothetical protein PR202_gb16690 [Eleusine coracana subsp. coracana]